MALKYFAFFIGAGCGSHAEPEHQDHVWFTWTIRFVSTTTISMKCLPKWIPLNSHVRFKEEGVGMEAGEVEGVGGEVKGGELVGEGGPLMVDP